MSKKRARFETLKSVREEVRNDIGKGPECKPNTLSRYLLKQWALGEMSAQQVQRIAEASSNDFSVLGHSASELPELEALANLGSRGVNPSKATQDLIKKLVPTNIIRSPVMVPLKKDRGEDFESMKQYFFLPHILFASIYEHYPRIWNTRILPQPSSLPAWWSSMKDTQFSVAHKSKMKDNWDRWAIPISIHGDGVGVVGVGKPWQKTKVYYSWQSMVGAGGHMETMMFIGSVWKHMISKAPSGDTRNTMWSMFGWSLKWLSRGEWPDKKWDGKPWPPGSWEAQKAAYDKKLAGGYKAWVVIMKGDLEYLYEESLANTMQNMLQNCNAKKPRKI